MLDVSLLSLLDIRNPTWFLLYAGLNTYRYVTIGFLFNPYLQVKCAFLQNFYLSPLFV